MARTKQTARQSTGGYADAEPQSETPGVPISSGGVFSETLHSITKTKLGELSKKRSVFEDQKSSLLASAQLELDQRNRLSILTKGLRKFFPTFVDGLTVKLANIERFLEQGRFDPSVTPELMQEWEQFLTDHLNVQSSKFQYASLYGELVTEWLQEESQTTVSQESVQETSKAEISDDSSTQEKDFHRSEWEEFVFTPFETDQGAVEEFLHSLFGKNVNKKAFNALEELREKVKQFQGGYHFLSGFGRSTLEWTIKGLLSSKLLTDEKRAVLRDFRSNTVVLDEIADVLNMRLSALDTWNWENEVTVEQRKRVNGRFEIYMHEDLLQAIFLQYIGVKWSVFFKSALVKFTKFEGAWTSLRRPISKLQKRRREYYLGEQRLKPTVQSQRQSLYHSHYFVSMLRTSEYEGVENVDGEEEAEMPMKRMRQRQSTGEKAPRKQLASKAARKSAPSNSPIQIYKDDSEFDLEENDGKPKNMMDLKQTLLHLLSTEIIFNTHFNGEITIFHSQFESWNQKLPHSTVSFIMAYFGVSPRWLTFFQKFLKAPLRFLDESVDFSRKRQRGVPESHVLSDVFSELVMFCMDFKVNQSTHGQQLYRMQDDLWFWSPSQETSVKAWTSINKFASIIGVPLSEEKSGSVHFQDDATMVVETSPELPDGPIRWGFLTLKSTESGAGKFVIDQSMVATQIASLKQHLFPETGERKSIFTWIRAWNTYASKFFSTNFGTPANCYGREHVDDILSTLQHMQNQIFADHGGSVTSYLKSELQERFGIMDVPDGFLYFATELGGLDVHSPFIPFICIREKLPADSWESILHFDGFETDIYEAAEDDFVNDRIDRVDFISEPNWKPENTEEQDTFFSFEEFIEWREEFSSKHEEERLAEIFGALLCRASTGPLAESVNTSNDMEIQEYRNMTPYERWVIQLYGPEMLKRFGRLRIAEKGWLPVGMVSLFKDGRMKM